jgi:hypothetical protein
MREMKSVDMLFLKNLYATPEITVRTVFSAARYETCQLRTAGLFQSIQDLGHSGSTHSQMTSKFCLGFDLSGVKQRLVISTSIHAIRARLLLFAFGLWNGRNGVPRVKLNFRRST